MIDSKITKKYHRKIRFEEDDKDDNNKVGRLGKSRY